VSIRVPYKSLLFRTLRAGMFLWLLVRAAYVVVLMTGSQTGLFTAADATEFALRPVVAARLLLVFIAAALVHIDRQRAHELLLQANFGVSTRWFTMAAMGGAGIADLTAQTILRLL
jgi:hypothetical protein